MDDNEIALYSRISSILPLMMIQRCVRMCVVLWWCCWKLEWTGLSLTFIILLRYVLFCSCLFCAQLLFTLLCFFSNLIHFFIFLIYLQFSSYNFLYMFRTGWSIIRRIKLHVQPLAPFPRLLLSRAWPLVLTKSLVSTNGHAQQRTRERDQRLRV